MNTETILEFNKVKEAIAEYACTKKAKAEIMALAPYMEEIRVLSKQKETTESRIMIEKLGNPPMSALEDIEEMTELAEKGGCLTAGQLEMVGLSLSAIKRLKAYLSKGKAYDLSLAYYDENLDAMEPLREEIFRVIRNGQVDDYASKLLKNLRSDIDRAESKMREKADATMRVHKDCMADNFSTMRNGHLCIPVKKEHKFRITGSVIAQSSTGSTLFMEPTAVAKYHEELLLLKLDEENEERRILYELTDRYAQQYDAMIGNIRMIERLDMAFAKGKYSIYCEGIEPDINTDRKIKIVNGRHPLMDKQQCVPLNIEMGTGEPVVRGIIITGPNTGGKTVAIKTTGLLCLMAQCGLHVPCESAQLCMNNQVLCDIGDNQNISENLSTFSAHITNVLDILKRANGQSLVIMDELGSGTDPTEGMGIAVAVLEELRRSGALYLVTTHYPEIKAYAQETTGVLNARMLFDRESLRPLYQLEMGAAGESCAFYIAKKLGMPDSMLSTAKAAAYGNMNILKDFDHAMGEKLKSPSIKKKKTYVNANENIPVFQRGDSVMVYPDKKIGIVCCPANDKGAIQVQLKGKKIWINHKRVKLHVPANQLYPEDYDFSIVFETVEERKIHHEMDRKYTEKALIIKDGNKPQMT